MNSRRFTNYSEFERILRGHPNVKLPVVPEHSHPSWFGVPMFIGAGRDDLAKHLEAQGVETRPILAGDLREQPGFRGFFYPKSLPGAERVQSEGLYVGLHPFPDSGAAEVAHMIADWSCV